MSINNIKNDHDTEVTAVNGIAICENCKDERDDIIEVSYVDWIQIGQYMTPRERVTEFVCYECFQEYY